MSSLSAGSGLTCRTLSATTATRYSQRLILIELRFKGLGSLRGSLLEWNKRADVPEVPRHLQVLGVLSFLGSPEGFRSRNQLIFVFGVFGVRERSRVTFRVSPFLLAVRDDRAVRLYLGGPDRGWWGG